MDTNWVVVCYSRFRWFRYTAIMHASPILSLSYHQSLLCSVAQNSFMHITLCQCTRNKCAMAVAQASVLNDAWARLVGLGQEGDLLGPALACLYSEESEDSSENVVIVKLPLFPPAGFHFGYCFTVFVYEVFSPASIKQNTLSKEVRVSVRWCFFKYLNIFILMQYLFCL